MVVKIQKALLFLCVFAFGLVKAQETTLRERIIPWPTDTIVLDSLPIALTSFSIDGFSAAHYTLLSAKSQLVMHGEKYQDSIKVSYRVILFNWNEEWFLRDSTSMTSAIQGLSNPFRMTASRQSPSMASGLDRQGSISRGIQTGNNQNLSVQSELNLRLQGKVADDLAIEAVISDQNIPVQPNGNTQVLQDFDQVYMRLFTDSWSLIGGDYTIRSKPSVFMKYNKRLRGIGFQANHQMLGNATNTALSGAISRGKFARNIIAGIEGNQGPYRLSGDEGEAYIVVLSGTERVFLDGKLLERGQDRDYIIDYNRAEVIFTSKHLITKDRRIIVEFQYSSDAYSRSLFQFGQTIKASERLEVYYDVYSEQDNQNAPILQDLSDDQVDYLSGIGDDLSLAFGSSAREAEFSETEVLYRLVEDTLGLDSVFVYSANPDSQLYRVTFTAVQPGVGDYVEVISTVNGRVFEVTPRMNNIPQGDYVAAIRLVTPKQRQMAMVGGLWKVNESNNIRFEGALSTQDVNLYSEMDDQDDLGGAGEVEWKIDQTVHDSGLRVIGGLKQQWVDGDFRFIERFRSVEFQRDWRLLADDELYDQLLSKGAVGLAKENHVIRYDLQRLGIGSSYEAWKHGAIVDWELGTWDVNYSGFLMNGRRDEESFEFYQHRSLIEKSLGAWVVGYKDYAERSKTNLPTITSNPYQFAEWELFLRTSDTLINSFRFAAGARSDDQLEGDDWVNSTRAEQAQFDYQNRGNRSFQWGLRGRYRKLSVADSSNYSGDDDEHFTGRVNYTARLWKGSVVTNAFFEYGSGREERYTYIFVEVQPGQGQYTWNDYNDDGVAQQNEFEIAQFQNEANYIRVVLPSNNYVTTNNADYSQSLLISPAVWRNKKGFKKAISYFSNQTNFRMAEKWYRDADWSFEDWIAPRLEDTNLVAVNQSIQNSLLFNRGGRSFNAEYVVRRSKSKQLQTSGSLFTVTNSDAVITRYSIKRSWRLEAELGKEETASGSDYLAERNYTIHGEYLRLGLFFIDPGMWDVRLTYLYKQKEAFDEQESGVLTNRIGLNLTKQRVGKASYQFEVAAVDNNYDPATNGSLSYALLEGLTPGLNLTWQSAITTTLAESLQLTLGYSGRYSEISGVIHNGSLQARLFF